MLEHLCCNQQTWEISWSTRYLLSNVYTGSGKTWELENHVDDIKMKQADESWWMMPQMSHAK